MLAFVMPIHIRKYAKTTKGMAFQGYLLQLVYYKGLYNSEHIRAVIFPMLVMYVNVNC